MVCLKCFEERLNILQISQKLRNISIHLYNTAVTSGSSSPGCKVWQMWTGRHIQSCGLPLACWDVGPWLGRCWALRLRRCCWWLRRVEQASAELAMPQAPRRFHCFFHLNRREGFLLLRLKHAWKALRQCNAKQTPTLFNCLVLQHKTNVTTQNMLKLMARSGAFHLSGDCRYEVYSDLCVFFFLRECGSVGSKHTELWPTPSRFLKVSNLSWSQNERTCYSDILLVMIPSTTNILKLVDDFHIMRLLFGRWQENGSLLVAKVAAWSYISDRRTTIICNPRATTAYIVLLHRETIKHRDESPFPLVHCNRQPMRKQKNMKFYWQTSQSCDKNHYSLAPEGKKKKSSTNPWIPKPF